MLLYIFAISIDFSLIINFFFILRLSLNNTIAWLKLFWLYYIKAILLRVLDIVWDIPSTKNSFSIFILSKNNCKALI